MYKILCLFLLILGVKAFNSNMPTNNLWSLLREPFKDKARKFFINRAKSIGIPWSELKLKYNNKETMEQLKKIYDYMRDERIKYPYYYLEPFHGYEEGNLNWDAATENEAATMSISANYWDGYSINDSSGYVRKNFTEKIKDYNKNKINKILDIGCSIGVSTNHLKNEFENAKFVFGVDLSPYFLSIAEYNDIKVNKNNLNFLHQNAESLDLNNDDFDLVTASFLFHEVPKEPTKKILREAYRVLNDGGTLAIIDLDPNKLKDKLDKDYFKRFFFESTEPHIYEYYNTNLEEELIKCNFKNIKKYSNDPLNTVWLATKYKDKPLNFDDPNTLFLGNNLYNTPKQDIEYINSFVLKSKYKNKKFSSNILN